MDTTMTPQKIPTLFLGIDVGKDRLDLALTDADGQPHAKHVRNDASGHTALLRWLGRFTDELSAVHACMEASGDYEQDAAVALHAAGLTVSVVNPRQTSAYAVAQLRRSKTDTIDAQLLARYCQREQPAPWQPPTDEARELRRLTRAIDALKRDRDRTRNRHGRSEGAARRALDAVLVAYGEQIAALEAAIEAHVAAHPELAARRDLLVSIPGVGPQTAAIVLAELGDSRAFGSARGVAAFAGLVPSHHISGTSVRKRPRLSKVGNARLRRALYFPAISAMRHNEAVRVFAERLLGRGKSKMSVIGASMRKLIQICYGVLKSGRPLDASLHPSA
ncbi:MAG: IS110 family transposase [Rubricoccaceae bacterium]